MKPRETLEVLRTFDREWAAVMRQRDIQLACYRGCSACCSEPCYTSREEAALILTKIPALERKGVVDRTRTWASQAVASGILRQGTPHVQQYLSANLVCPLLKDNLCLVYAARPLACRSHCAVGVAVTCKVDRMNQKFAKAPALIVDATRQMMCEGDHLGVWLSKALLRESPDSAATVSVSRMEEIAQSILKVAEGLAGAAVECRQIAEKFKV